MRVFITGNPGSGKTTLVKKLADFLLKNDVSFSGFYTLETRNKGKRTGFKLTIIPEENVYTLASLNPPGISFGRYYVKTEGTERGIKALKREANVYIVDEVGPMEAKHPDFMPAVKDLLETDKNIIAVIHRKMTDLVEKENLYRISPENRNDLYEKLKNLIRDNLPLN